MKPRNKINNITFVFKPQLLLPRSNTRFKKQASAFSFEWNIKPSNVELSSSTRRGNTVYKITRNNRTTIPTCTYTRVSRSIETRGNTSETYLGSRLGTRYRSVCQGQPPRIRGEAQRAGTASTTSCLFDSQRNHRSIRPRMQRASTRVPRSRIGATLRASLAESEWTDSRTCVPFHCGYREWIVECRADR